MKRAKIISAVVCLLIDIVICVAVCWQWKQVGCNPWSLFAAIIFYSIGCFGLWMLIDQIIEWVFWLDNQERYPDNPTIR